MASRAPEPEAGGVPGRCSPSARTQGEAAMWWVRDATRGYPSVQDEQTEVGVHGVYRNRKVQCGKIMNRGSGRTRIFRRLVKEFTFDLRIRARSRKGPGFNWGGQDSSGILERQL